MIENVKEPEEQDSLWNERIQQAEKDSNPWWERCKKIKDIYRDKRDGTANAVNDTKRFNILWANIQTTNPVLYSRMPIPVVMAKDFVKDQSATLVSTAIKRTLNSEIKEYDFDGTIKETILEYQLTARGTVWIAYNPYFESLDELDVDGNPKEVKVDENAYCVFLNHKDFIHSKARVWEEVTWVGRRLELTRKECKDNFPEYKQWVFGENKKVTIWEIWDKDSGKQIFFAPDQAQPRIKEGPVPIEFEEFFPCPKPLFSNLDNESIIPVPDYILYQDQAGDLNKYTNRLSKLGDAIKVIGLYSSVNTNLQNVFEQNQENVMVASSTPLDGGDKSFQFFPLDVFAACAAQTAELKNMVKQDIYELTGLSDIVRGASDPNETATAQNIKNQWGALRVKEKQKDVQRFIRDILRLKAEVIAEHFSREKIELSSGVQLTPEAEQLMRNGVLRTFMIDVETDSTIEPDAQQEKQDRTEFMTAFSQYLKTGMEIANAAPAAGPLISQMIMFAMRAYPIGAEMEQEIKQALDQMAAEQQQKAQNPQPDPEVQKAQLQAQTQKEIEGMKAQTQKEVKQMEIQADFGLKNLELQGQQQIEEKKAATQSELTRMGLKSTEKLARVKAKSGAAADIETDSYGIADEEEELTKLDKLGQAQLTLFEGIQQQTQALQMVAQQQQETAQFMAQIMEAVTAEKEVIRNEKGKVVGSRIKRPVLN